MEALFLLPYAMMAFAYGAYLGKTTYIPDEGLILLGLSWVVVIPIHFAIWVGSKLGNFASR